MKKLLFVVLMIFSLSLVGCSSNTEEKSGDNESVSVDKGLVNVEFTLPASFFEGENMDEVIKTAKEEGVKEVTQNEDGSVTYKMSKSEHKKIMGEMEEEIVSYIEELKTGDDYTTINDVEYNKSFDEFTIVVASEEEYSNAFDSIAVFGLGIQGTYYQVFDGTNIDDVKVTIHLKDESTSEVFHTTVYPDDFENLDEAE